MDKSTFFNDFLRLSTFKPEEMMATVKCGSVVFSSANRDKKTFKL